MSDNGAMREKVAALLGPGWLTGDHSIDYPIDVSYSSPFSATISRPGVSDKLTLTMIDQQEGVNRMIDNENIVRRMREKLDQFQVMIDQLTEEPEEAPSMRAKVAALLGPGWLIGGYNIDYPIDAMYGWLAQEDDVDPATIPMRIATALRTALPENA